jgi:hypothetical protein
MAQIRRNFLKSKMNKDLDARLLTNGEYREGRNINVSRSEGSDVGALENVLGNQQVAFGILNSIRSGLDPNETLEVIGLFKHDETKSIYLFCTTWIDSSTTGLDNKYGGHNWIIQVTLPVDPLLTDPNLNPTSITKVLVQGSFLNFAKSWPITGCNIIEDQLFWTDNRNQPRKININKGAVSADLFVDPISNQTYYYTEDQISVAKFAPYEPIKFIKNIGGPTTANWQPTWKNETDEFLPISLSAPINTVITTTQLGFGATITSTNKPRWDYATHSIADYIIKSAGNTYPLIEVSNFDRPNGGKAYIHEIAGNVITAAASKTNLTIPGSFPSSWVAGDILTFKVLNPEYNSNFTGDREYMKDKFIRFSYRFKYEDNEYSLMAPFTQPLFIPKQYGSFTAGDEANAAVNSMLNWFENLINSAELNIQLPNLKYQKVDNSPSNSYSNRFKIKEIEILLKSSNNNNVYVIDTIEIDDANQWQTNLVSNSYTTWPYNSQLLYNYKGIKPFQVLPESDVIRVSDITPVKALAQEVAGNRVMYGNYQNAHAAPKTLDYECFSTKKSSDYNASNNPPISTSNETTVKEYYNSTIKQGRTYQVGVVLSDRYGRQSNVILANTDYSSGSTSRDKSTVFVPYDGVGISPGETGFFGNALNISFENVIPSILTNEEFWPGLYDINKSGPNIITQGVTNPLGWYSYKIVVKQQEQEYYNCYIPGALSGNVVYTNASTALDYSDIYQVANISLFGDNINKIPKDTTNISPTDKIFGSNTSLYYRVFSPVYVADNKYYNVEFTPVTEIDVVNIQPFPDFGPWTNNKGTASYPTSDPLYNADKNPFVATLDISGTETSPPRLGFPDGAVTGGQNNSFFSKFLNVAETNPVLSDLDIYWETTSSGLISDLNEAISDGDTLNGPKELSPFLWLMEEGLPYDGEGTLPSYDGKYLLQQDIGVVTNNDVLSSDANAALTLISITSSQGGFIPPDPLQNIVLVATETVAAGDPANKWNLKFNSQNVTSGNVFNPDFNLNALGGNLTFTFELSIPGETPATKQVQITDNFMSNNLPTWTYLVPPSWGITPIVPNPSDPADLLKGGYPGEYCNNTTLLANKRPELSPFQPIPKNLLTTNNTDATDWASGRDIAYSMSIAGQKKAGTTNTNLGKLFERKNNEWLPFINIPSKTGYNKSYYVGAGDKFNSAIGFNDYKFGTRSQAAPLGIMWANNGSFERDIHNITFEITNCELAIFNNGSFSGYPGVPPTPVRDYRGFTRLFTDSNIDGPQFDSDSNTWGYRKYPFDIKIPTQDDVFDTGFDYLNNAGYFYLLADPYNPPFCQIGSTKSNGKFKPLGELNGSDFCVYRITITLKENFSGGSTSPNQMVVYVKLYQ